MNRRNFVRTAAVATGALSFGSFINPSDARSLADPSLYMIGPLPGYSPQIGTLVSMLNYNRMTVLNQVKDLTMEQLDFLFDKKANTIGALIMHLGATNRFYHVNTFEGKELSEDDKKIWGAAMDLGDAGRKEIKGHDVNYYINLITGVRQQTLEEFKKKDDDWLMKIDPDWSKKESLNCYWKWFHVCEHESNHRGQITWLKNRLPGAGNSKE